MDPSREGKLGLRSQFFSFCHSHPSGSSWSLCTPPPEITPPKQKSQQVKFRVSGVLKAAQESRHGSLQLEEVFGRENEASSTRLPCGWLTWEGELPTNQLGPSWPCPSIALCVSQGLGSPMRPRGFHLRMLLMLKIKYPGLQSKPITLKLPKYFLKQIYI